METWFYFMFHALINYEFEKIFWKKFISRFLFVDEHKFEFSRPAVAYPSVRDIKITFSDWYLKNTFFWLPFCRDVRQLTLTAAAGPNDAM